MARHEWNVDVAAFADRLAIVHRFQNGKKAGMFLHQACEGIQITRTDMWSERAPLWKGRARCLHGGGDIRRGTLGNRCKSLSVGRIDRLEVLAGGRCLPCAVDEMFEATAV